MPGEYQKPLRLVSTGGGMRYYRSNETALEGARAQGRGMYQLESVRGGGHQRQQPAYKSAALAV